MSDIREKLYDYPSRTLCDVLGEMRKCCDCLNFASLRALVEEAQSMGNRMEAALTDKSRVVEWRKKKTELKTEIRKLQKELKVLDAKKARRVKRDKGGDK